MSELGEVGGKGGKDGCLSWEIWMSILRGMGAWLGGRWVSEFGDIGFLVEKDGPGYHGNFVVEGISKKFEHGKL